MEPTSKCIYRSCNVEFVESRNFSDLKSHKQNYQFTGDNFVYEQPDLDANVVDHTYVMAHILISKCKHSLGDCVPTSFKDAIHSPFAQDWKKAICEELTSLFENNTWELVSRCNVNLVPIPTL